MEFTALDTDLVEGLDSFEACRADSMLPPGERLPNSLVYIAHVGQKYGAHKHARRRFNCAEARPRSVIPASVKTQISSMLTCTVLP